MYGLAAEAWIASTRFGSGELFSPELTVGALIANDRIEFVEIDESELPAG